MWLIKSCKLRVFDFRMNNSLFTNFGSFCDWINRKWTTLWTEQATEQMPWIKMQKKKRLGNWVSSKNHRNLMWHLCSFFLFLFSLVIDNVATASSSFGWTPIRRFRFDGITSNRIALYSEHFYSFIPYNSIFFRTLIRWSDSRFPYAAEWLIYECYVASKTYVKAVQCVYAGWRLQRSS